MVFDCLDQELLIAKLNAYGFSLTPHSSWPKIVWGAARVNSRPTIIQCLLTDLF